MTLIYKEFDCMKDIDFLELRDGKSFDKFFRRTKKEWDRLAYKVLSSVEHPTWIDVEDVSQHMAMNCIKAVSEWNPEKSASIKSYVIIVCYEKAKKYLHHFRVSKGPERNGPPRFDLPFCEFTEEAADHQGTLSNLIASKLTAAPTQERHLAIKRLVNGSSNYEIVSAMVSGKNSSKMIREKKRTSKPLYINKLYEQVCSL